MSQTSPEPEPIPDTVPSQAPQSAPGQAPPPVYTQNRPGWLATLARQADQTQQGAVKWFYDAGNLIFGLLTVTAVLVSLDLILLGSPDHAALVSGLAIAIALPFNLVGLWLVYYLKDASHADPTPAKKQLIDSTAFIALSVGTLFTSIGLGSALWRISWAVTILFLVISILGLWLILRVLRYSA